ncbi:MAG TPA: response regulator transcription factor [Cytophagaceae bacterium]|jgi:DNA-binding NarL/FixJ family response regulator|nr:response regulator transcription factor [Cytophagaceae bacterium]
MNKIKIIISDDHRLIRDGIKSMLARNENFELIGEAENGDELIKLLQTTVPDVILLDITMPGKNGIEIFTELKKINSNLKFILLTMHEEPEYVIKAVKGGASGYLLKNLEYEELEKAVLTVAEGGKYFNERISKILLENLYTNTEEEAINDKLTERELEVLAEIVSGLTTKQIAEKLFISHRTVETHRVNLMRKLAVHNIAELVKIAIDRKIV